MAECREESERAVAVLTQPSPSVFRVPPETVLRENIYYVWLDPADQFSYDV